MLVDAEISAVRPDEVNFVRDSWMRNSRWRRASMLRTLDDCTILVARIDGVIAGWIAATDDALAMGYTREPFREAGVFRELWNRVGQPRKILSPAARGAHGVMRRLLKSREL